MVSLGELPPVLVYSCACHGDKGLAGSARGSGGHCVSRILVMSIMVMAHWGML